MLLYSLQSMLILEVLLIASDWPITRWRNRLYTIRSLAAIFGNSKVRNTVFIRYLKPTD